MNSVAEFLFVITNFNFLLIFKIGAGDGLERCGCNSWELLHQYGPFTAQSNCTMFLDDNCTYMAHLNQKSTALSYYLFDWLYKCKAVRQPVPPRDKSPDNSPVLDEAFLHSAKDLKGPVVAKRTMRSLTLDSEKMKMMKENIRTSKMCNIF